MRNYNIIRFTFNIFRDKEFRYYFQYSFKSICRVLDSEDSINRYQPNINKKGIINGESVWAKHPFCRNYKREWNSQNQPLHHCYPMQQHNSASPRFPFPRFTFIWRIYLASNQPRLLATD